MKLLKELSRKPDIYERLASALAPSIYEHEDIKRESYFNSLVEQGRISVTLEGVNSVLRLTSFCVVTLAPASPSCYSMYTTWFPEASTHLEKAPVQLASQPM